MKRMAHALVWLLVAGATLAASSCAQRKAAVTSLGLLATPVVGTLMAALALGEPITLTLLSAMTLIIGGIALGTFTHRQRH